MERELATIARLFKGSLHGVDARGFADVEFPNVAEAAAFAVEFLDETTMRQEWAPGVDGHFIQLGKPVVLTFPLSVFSDSIA